MALPSLSLQQPGFVPQPLSSLMPGGAAVVAHVVQSFVVPPEKQVLNQEEIGLEQPYTDPSLKGRKQLSRLIRLLLDRSLVELSLEDGTRIGVFAVWKSDGERMRLIIDARLSNTHFTEPPPVSLPGAENLSQVHVASSESLHVSTSDLKDAFYTMEMPPELRKFYTFSPV